jgi:hypothetical protein
MYERTHWNLVRPRVSFVTQEFPDFENNKGGLYFQCHFGPYWSNIKPDSETQIGLFKSYQTNRLSQKTWQAL